MILSVTNDKRNDPSNLVECHAALSEGWYPTEADEVFVLDFGEENTMLDEEACRMPFADTNLFDGEGDTGETNIFGSALSTFDEPSPLLDGNKEVDASAKTVESCFEREILSNDLNSSGLMEHSSAQDSSLNSSSKLNRDDLLQKSIGATIFQDIIHPDSKTSVKKESKNSKCKNRNQVESSNECERKLLYGDSWHIVEKAETDSNGKGFHIKTYSNGSLKQKRTSKFRGVSCCGKDRKWQARIRESNRVRYLGRFQTEVEAAVVYDEASRQCKGEGAPTNFVRMDTETMKKLQEAYEKLGYIPASFRHLIANPRKTKPKKPSEKRPYNKKRRLENQLPRTPLSNKKTKRNVVELSGNAMSPSMSKISPDSKLSTVELQIPNDRYVIPKTPKLKAKAFITL